MSDGVASSACLKDCLTEIADLQDYTFYQTMVRDLMPPHDTTKLRLPCSSTAEVWNLGLLH